MARGNKFKPEGHGAVVAEQTRPAAPAKDATGEPRPCQGLQPRGATGKRKRETAPRVTASDGKQAHPSVQSNTGVAKSSVSHAAANGHSSVALAARRNIQGQGHVGAILQHAKPASAAILAARVGQLVKAVLARPRSKKKRLLAKAAKAGSPAGRLPTSAVLDSCHVSTVVAPPLKGGPRLL